MTAYDTERLKADNPIHLFLALRGHELKTAGPAGFRGRCPIHRGDGKTAFSVQSDGMGFYCHRCEAKGDVIDLVKALDGLDFTGACQALRGLNPGPTPLRPSQARKPVILKPAPVLPELDAGKRKEMDDITERLRRDTALQEAIAASRGWNPVTISALTLPDSTTQRGYLGWIDDPGRDSGRIAFVYPNAVKYRPLYRDCTYSGGWRWHRPDGSKITPWLWKDWPWNAAELWRENRFLSSPIARDSCILTEGEPDAISALDDFLETTFRAVVAIPSAGIGPGLRARLPHVLRNIEVSFMADNDSAGQKAAMELPGILRGAARSLKILPLQKAV